jgi:hypothetical protein
VRGATCPAGPPLLCGACPSICTGNRAGDFCRGRGRFLRERGRLWGIGSERRGHPTFGGGHSSARWGHPTFECPYATARWGHPTLGRGHSSARSGLHALLALSNAAAPSVVRIRIEGMRGPDAAAIVARVVAVCESHAVDAGQQSDRRGHRPVARGGAACWRCRPRVVLGEGSEPCVLRSSSSPSWQDATRVVESPGQSLPGSITDMSGKRGEADFVVEGRRARVWERERSP